MSKLNLFIVILLINIQCIDDASSKQKMLPFDPVFYNNDNENIVRRQIKVSVTDDNLHLSAGDLQLIISKNGGIKYIDNNAQFISDIKKDIKIKVGEHIIISNENIIKNVSSVVEAKKRKIDIGLLKYSKYDLKNNSVYIYFEQVESNNNITTLIYEVRLVVLNLSGVEWNGFAIGYELATGNNLIQEVSVGGEVIPFNKQNMTSWYHSSYGKTRGFRKAPLKSGLFSGEIKHKNNQVQSQVFSIIGANDFSHLSFEDASANSSIVYHATSRGYNHKHIYNVSKTSSSIKIPLQYHFFSDSEVTIDQYLSAKRYITNYYLDAAGIKRQRIIPTAGASVGSQIKAVKNWKNLADKVIPVVKEYGFKRVWAGQNPTIGQQYNFQYENKESIFDELKYYTNLAHENDIEVFLWIELVTTSEKSNLIKKHPEWALRQHDGSIPHYVNKPDVLILRPNSDYLFWLKNQLDGLHKNTGIDGVWLDSFGYAYTIQDYRSGIASSYYDELLKFIIQLQKIGLGVYGEAETPYVISSNWFRKDRSLPYNGNEFSLSYTSPYTNRPDSDYVDYFLSASYHAFPIIDIHPFIDDKDIYRNQSVFKNIIKNTNHIVNKIDQLLNDNFEVHALPYGTYWTDGKTHAIFVNSSGTSVTFESADEIYITVYDANKGEYTNKGEYIKNDQHSNGTWVFNNLQKGMVIIISKYTRNYCK